MTKIKHIDGSAAVDLFQDPDVALTETIYQLNRKRKETARASLLDHQRVPDGDWDNWIIMGGRGSGKTFAGVNAVVEHLREFGSDAWVMIVAPTKDDARDIILEGPSGLWTLFRNEFVSYHKTLLKLKHIGGGQVKIFSADEPNRLRGPQSSLLWIDEIAIILEESVDNARFGNRLGDYPRLVATTTPRKRVFLKELLNEPDTIISRATTDDNPHLSEKARSKLYRKYGGTRLGRQELKGELIEDVEGAMFKSEWIDNARVQADQVPDFERVVVSIDPAGTSKKPKGRKSKRAATGIAATARGVDGDYYVLSSNSYFASPGTWARKSVELYDDVQADKIIGENNYGGDMVESTIRNEWDDAPFEMVRASRGKVIRAEPVAGLCEQGRVHFVGVFPGLEGQMYSFPVEDELKDELDAMVWGIIYLSENTEDDTLLISRVGG